MKSIILRLKYLTNKKYNFFFYFIFFFLNFYQVSNATCKIDYSDNPSLIPQIIINFENNRKWIKNLSYIMNAKNEHKHEFNISFFLKKNHKKRHAANVEFNLDNGNKCTFRSTVRYHGDYPDHVKFYNGNLFSSLNVKLIEDNINNITNFLLLLPETRQGDNELFVANLMSEIGFLSPRTSYVDIIINGKRTKYIFQEVIRKEFLENQKKIEGPLLEGHEVFEKNPSGTVSSTRLGIAKDRPFLSRISNERWIKTSRQKVLSSLNALSAFNIIYLKDPGLTDKYAVTQVLEIEKDILDYDENKRNNIFEALMYALGSTNNLSRDDRRFYYDSIYDEFFNIYYDGGSRILEPEKLKSLNLDYYDAEKFTGEDKNALIWNPSVNFRAKSGSKDAVNLVKSIDQSKFLKKLEKNGLFLSKKKLSRTINLIIERLTLISNANIIQKDFVLPKSFYSSYSKNFLPSDKLVFYLVNQTNEIEENINFIVCDLNLNKCELDEKLNINHIRKLVNQDFFTTNDKNIISRYIFVGENLEDYKNGNMHRVNFGLRKFKKHKIENDFLLATNKYVDLDIDYENKNINILNKNWKGRTVIYKSTISNWNIYMDTLDENEFEKSKIILNQDNLTGCFTILDSNLKNISFYSTNSKCEDSINIIRSNGDLKLISIEKSIRDALDADFSNLEFENISIMNAFNDCIDFSNGIYFVKHSSLESCGDKGISAGEKTTANFENINISNASIGIATKDSSNVKVNKSQISNTKICLSVYKKKQEFNGANLQILNSRCQNYHIKTDVDNNSILNLTKEF